METRSIFTQFLPSFNKQFIKRLLCRWVIIFVILNLAAWLFFLQINVQALNQISWRAADKSPGIIALIGLPAMLVASVVVALLHTKTDRKNNYPRIFWIAYFIPITILLCTDYFSYRYYINYTTQRDQKRRQDLEQEVKLNQHPNYVLLADMYQNGWGGPQDATKAAELYQKGCEDDTANSLVIQACKKAKNYQKLRILLIDSNDPYDWVTLATIYEKGLGGPQDIAKAKELYQKACPEKDSFICKEYKPFQ